MVLRWILILWIFTIFIVGVAIATETDDVDETINDIDDSLTAIDIALDGNEMLQKQLGTIQLILYPSQWECKRHTDKTNGTSHRLHR